MGATRYMPAIEAPMNRGKPDQHQRSLMALRAKETENHSLAEHASSNFGPTMA
jgi:hypothetical protein